MAISVFWQRVLIGLAVVVGALLFAGIWVIIIRRRRYAAQARILEEERLDRLQTISQSLINQQKLEERARKKAEEEEQRAYREVERIYEPGIAKREREDMAQEDRAQTPPHAKLANRSKLESWEKVGAPYEISPSNTPRQKT